MLKDVHVLVIELNLPVDFLLELSLLPFISDLSHSAYIRVYQPWESSHFVGCRLGSHPFKYEDLVFIRLKTHFKLVGIWHYPNNLQSFQFLED